MELGIANRGRDDLFHGNSRRVGLDRHVFDDGLRREAEVGQRIEATAQLLEQAADLVL